MSKADNLPDVPDSVKSGNGSKRSVAFAGEVGHDVLPGIEGVPDGVVGNLESNSQLNMNGWDSCRCDCTLKMRRIYLK